MIHKEATEDGQVWPPIVGLCKSVVIALTYMRRNRVQVELAETYDVSQSTISRAITGITPLLGKLLRKYVPTADELDNQKRYVVDGTLLPCWSWAGHPELYSGKHKTTGMNVQVACTLDVISHGYPIRLMVPTTTPTVSTNLAPCQPRLPTTG